VRNYIHALYIFLLTLEQSIGVHIAFFPFKSVPFPAAMSKLPCAWLWDCITLRIVHASYIVYGLDPSPKVPVHIPHLKNIVKSCF
jgi:hypothetical protein